VTVEAPIFAG